MERQQTTQDVKPEKPQHTTGSMVAPQRQQYDGGAQEQSRLERMRAERLARALGWFSVGLGLTEVVAPRGIAQLVGARGDHRRFIRLLGMREIAHGVGILTQRRPVRAMWSRVIGDAMDLACLGVTLTSPRAKQNRVAGALAAVLGVTYLDVLCAQRLSRSAGITTASGAICVRKSVIINRSPEDLYRFWHDFQNLPRFMFHLESVRTTGQGRSHWVANVPAGMRVAWDAEITADEPHRVIAWHALQGSDVYHTGSVRFERAPGGRGTVVTVEIAYRPPGSVIGTGLAMLFGTVPGQHIQRDLRRFKQLMETGEVVQSEGSRQGTGIVAQRPAQPPAGQNRH